MVPASAGTAVNRMPIDVSMPLLWRKQAHAIAAARNQQMVQSISPNRLTIKFSLNGATRHIAPLTSAVKGLAGAAMLDRGKHLFDRPTEVQPIAYRMPINTKHGGPLLHGQGLAVQCQSDIVGPIVLLLNTSSPTAVARLIALRVVNAIYRSSSRLFSHIFQKSHEIMPPAVAHSYAASAISLEAGRTWLITADQHPSPSLMGSSSTAAMGSPIPTLSGPNIFAVASAGFAMTN